MSSPPPAPGAHPAHTPTPRIASDGARFLPGQVLADRYRMVGLLGKGGMGEVYRADDMKLGQPVALKFLPREVEADADRLERFLTEVRLSLRVTHPNVCRVFDIGQVPAAAGQQEGRHFLSMEYVDGEDLASLLRRIGRLPEDKAVEIARQLCAGLSAAHDEGVLHRDLKPANVMLDGRGRAKITDFGLAGATAGIRGHEARAGTPQYMAPEQFDGRELTVQTDLYSLGLVLYELFTGKRAFEGGDLVELASMRSSAPTSPSAHLTTISPIVERAILRCLDPDPALRPRSAAALAAALPGGDPLAMAMAAGETPSPEMVARSGGRGELRPVIAIACLLIVLAGLGANWWAEQRTNLHNLVPLPKPPAELRVAARAALAAAGYTAPASAIEFGFQGDFDYFDRVIKNDPSSGRWNNLASVTPVPVWFWYRESPRAMGPMSDIGYVGLANPPMDEPGMMRVRLDPSGRLQELRVVPNQLADKPGPYAEPDWAPLFAAAGLVREEWAAAEPAWAPPDASDVRRAWSRGTVRLEAAAFRGRPVWFRVVPDWRQPDEVALGQDTFGERAAGFANSAVLVVIMIGGALLARRNIRQGRSDRRGASRLAGAFVAVGVASISLKSGASWYGVLGPNLAMQLFTGAVIWIFYVAIEPYVRRWWPGTLVAWSRALDGQFRDPMVGRHLLLGSVAGMAFSFFFTLPFLAASTLGLGAPPKPIGNFGALVSPAERIAAMLGTLQSGLTIPVGVLIGVLLCRVIFRRPWLAYLMVYILFAVFTGIWSQPADLMILLPLLVTLILLILTRLGLFAFLVAIVYSSWSVLGLTADPSSWFFGGSVFTMAVFAAVAIYGFVISLGGQKIFKDAI
jgi:serine/threonine-protein kinase